MTFRPLLPSTLSRTILTLGTAQIWDRTLFVSNKGEAEILGRAKPLGAAAWRRGNHAPRPLFGARAGKESRARKERQRRPTQDTLRITGKKDGALLLCGLPSAHLIKMHLRLQVRLITRKLLVISSCSCSCHRAGPSSHSIAAPLSWWCSISSRHCTAPLLMIALGPEMEVRT